MPLVRLSGRVCAQFEVEQDVCGVSPTDRLQAFKKRLRRTINQRQLDALELAPLVGIYQAPGSARARHSAQLWLIRKTLSQASSQNQ